MNEIKNIVNALKDARYEYGNELLYFLAGILYGQGVLEMDEDAVVRLTDNKEEAK